MRKWQQVMAVMSATMKTMMKEDFARLMKDECVDPQHFPWVQLAGHRGCPLGTLCWQTCT
eukprot:8850749-Karenia_brevis.AAC.1